MTLLKLHTRLLYHTNALLNVTNLIACNHSLVFSFNFNGISNTSDHCTACYFYKTSSHSWKETNLTLHYQNPKNVLSEELKSEY